MIEDATGLDVTDSMVVGLSVSGITKLKSQLNAGGTAAASPYKITFIAVTSLGNIYEIDGKIRVVEL
jgi:hypothetical protein